MRPSDTDPAAERVQLDLFRHATVARRASLARSLSSTVMQLTQRAIEERDPTAATDELNVQFVAICYGAVLARGLRRHLEARRRLRESCT